VKTHRVTRLILCLAVWAIGCADVRSGSLPPQSTNSSGTNSDSRCLALARAAPNGETQDEPNNPARQATQTFIEAKRVALAAAAGRIS
jgi:hypothetical protein